ncbi:hypothetical protein F5Y19DRAFT_468735 [Xylariaceae sp. FL1651]|nr:hypothetical protein F5Y19DRAFT_468735 [Xylariaceae sp. FL1651]
MAMPGFLAQAQAQPFRSTAPSTQSMHSLSMTALHPYDRDATSKPVGTPFATAPSPACQVLIRRLPIDTTEETLRLMLLFSQELLNVEILSSEQSNDSGFRSAIVKFKTAAGAQQAKEMLHGKSIGSNEAELVVEIMSGSPTSSRRYLAENTISTQTSVPSSVNSSGGTSHQSTRFSEAFQSLEKISPPSNGLYGSSELPDPESSAHYQSLFSPQSPIGNHLTDRTRALGKTLIHDTAEDDETRDILNDPVAYAENGATQQRRATAPHLPISRMANLSLNTNTNGAASLPPYGHSTMTPLSAHGNSMSPTIMNGANQSMNFQISSFHRHNFPPVNPADQNPPCNTLYVGNLPIDTSEEELKAMFSKQRGYKRLCFRTKQNGPMCFVEFEDISHATRALHELYGQPLHNSVKGGIRLSFSKNPLGVRSGQAAGPPANGSMASMNGLLSTSNNGFTSANGPPPGLTAPPGLNRVNYNGSSPSISNGTSTPFSSAGYSSSTSHVWSNPLYNSPLSAVGSSSSSTNGSTSAFPSYMMGR